MEHPVDCGNLLKRKILNTFLIIFHMPRVDGLPNMTYNIAIVTITFHVQSVVTCGLIRLFPAVFSLLGQQIHKKKSNGVISGHSGSHSIGSLGPIHLSRKFPKKNM